MRVEAIQPDITAASYLDGAQFIDAYSTLTSDTALTARQAAERMFSRQPRWIAGLMAVRDRIVSLFGLKTEQAARSSASNRVGMFPVLDETHNRLVAGLNDRHLDFRVVVDVAEAGQRQRVTATTIVLTHNLLGRVYLAIIMPFHRLIVSAMLRQIAN